MTILKTSITHPLMIAGVKPAGGMGQIGITFCPGKYQPDAMSGGWNRDLGADLDAISDWGAVAVVTLLESQELEALRVEQLGEEVKRRHIDWFHLPIGDVSIPTRQFELAWEDVGAGLSARLRDGFSIVIHCKGGLGRAGTVAARLLVELGWSPGEAIAKVRTVRPGAIENTAQERYVRLQAALSELRPEDTRAAVSDRAVGAFIGLAVGDAIGTTLEFQPRDSYTPVTGMTGGGPFGLNAGEWTDDTAMALALADSLVAHPNLDAADLMSRFVAWSDAGEYSCTGTCFDIGITTSQALQRWKRTGNAFAGSTDPLSAGNGSLMRLAPVALRHWKNPELLAAVAREQSRTTHGAPEAVDACAHYAAMLADAIAGLPRSEVLRNKSAALAGGIADIAAGSWRGKPRNAIRSSGYVAHSLEAAIWSVGRSSDFAGAVLLAANLGDDADTTAAIAGQLAGAMYGASGIPERWLQQLAWRPRLEATARELFENGF